LTTTKKLEISLNEDLKKVNTKYVLLQSEQTDSENSLKKKLKEQEGEIARLITEKEQFEKKKLESERLSKAEIISLQNTINTFFDENIKLAEDLQQAKDKNARYEASAARLKSEGKVLSAEAHQYSSESYSPEKSLQQLKNTIGELTHEKEQFAVKMKKLEAEKSEWAKEKEELTNELAKMGVSNSNNKGLHDNDRLEDNKKDQDSSSNTAKFMKGIENLISTIVLYEENLASLKKNMEKFCGV